MELQNFNNLYEEFFSYLCNKIEPPERRQFHVLSDKDFKNLSYLYFCVKLNLHKFSKNNVSYEDEYEKYFPQFCFPCTYKRIDEQHKNWHCLNCYCTESNGQILTKSENVMEKNHFHQCFHNKEIEFCNCFNNHQNAYPLCLRCFTEKYVKVWKIQTEIFIKRSFMHGKIIHENIDCLFKCIFCKNNFCFYAMQYSVDLSADIIFSDNESSLKSPESDIINELYSPVSTIYKVEKNNTEFQPSLYIEDQNITIKKRKREIKPQKPRNNKKCEFCDNNFATERQAVNQTKSHYSKTCPLIGFYKKTVDADIDVLEFTNIMQNENNKKQITIQYKQHLQENHHEEKIQIMHQSLIEKN